MKILQLKSTIFSLMAFALLAVFLLNPSFTFATQYYVSTAGKDSNNGTSKNTSFKTLTKVNSLNLKPGDIVSLKGGQTFTYTNRSVGIKIKNSGTAQAPIILNSYGGGKAIIKSTNTIGILVEDASHIKVNNLILRGDFVAKKFASVDEISVPTNVGVLVSSKLKDCDNVIVENIEASKFQWEGIRFESNKASVAVKNSEIRNCKTYDNGNRGIGTNGKNGGCNKEITISDCESYNNRGWNAIPTGSGIHVSGACGITIQHCVAYNNGAYNNSDAGGFGIWASSSSDVLVQFNESYNNKTGKADGGGFDMDGGVQRAIVQYNYSHDNDGGGFLIYQHNKGRTLKDVTIRYNISENDSRNAKHGAIEVSSISTAQNNMQDIFIYNNTIFNNKNNVSSIRARKISARENLTNVKIYNNLLIRPNDGVSIQINDTNNIKEQNNFTIKNGNLVVQNAGQGGTLLPNKRLTDLNAYKLKNNEDVVNKGINLKQQFGFNVGKRDFYGNSIPQNDAFDIGAHEYFGGIIDEPCLEKLTSNKFSQQNANSVPGWKTHKGGDAVASSSNNSTGVAHININNGANFDYNVQLWQDGLEVKAGKTYKVVAKIRADGNRKVRLIVRPVNLPDNGRFYMDETFDVTTQFQSIPLYFTIPEDEFTNPDESNVRLSFLIGGNNTDVFIDEVSFKEDCSVCEPEQLLKQNNFTQNNTQSIPGWKAHQGNGAAMNSGINQWGVAEFNISNGGTHNYDLQFWQDGLSIEAGSTYIVRVKMRAAKNRNVRLIVRPVQLSNGEPFIEEGDRSITSDFKEYFIQFTAEKKETDVRFSILLGGNDADVFVDWVTFKKVCNDNRLSSADITSPQLAQIYPNPVSNYLKVQLYEPIEAAEIAVFDVHGKLMHTQTIHHAGEASIDVSRLLSGSYFIRIQSGDVVETQKILKY